MNVSLISAAMRSMDRNVGNHSQRYALARHEIMQEHPVRFERKFVRKAQLYFARDLSVTALFRSLNFVPERLPIVRPFGSITWGED